MKIKKGKLIVLEGTDGAGKGTQLQLLDERLSKLKVPHKIIDFPQYEDNPYGELIGRYLKGEFGSLGQVNRYFLALAYAGDRVVAKPKLEKWLSSGNLVIANRYASSHRAYSTATLSKQDRIEFLKWCRHLEYEVNGVPKEELVLLLYLDPEIAQKKVDEKLVRSYLGTKTRDIHESNIEYQKAVAQNYLELAKEEPNWQVVNCGLGEGMRSKEEIHQEVVHILNNKGLI